MAQTADQAYQQAYQQNTAAWQAQTIKSGSTISGNTVSGVPGVATNPVALELYNMTDAARLQIAKTLKNAGYNVPQTGKFNDALVTQWSNVTMAAKLQAQSIGQPFDSNYLTGYLKQNIPAAAASNKPSKYVQKNISNATNIAAILDTIANDLLGRQLNAQEKAKYTTMLQAEQNKAASAVVTNTVPSGTTTTSTTTGGLDAQQYLIQKISGTDEAKANKVLTAYDTVTKMFGGLR